MAADVLHQLRQAKASPALIEQVVRLLASAAPPSSEPDVCPHCHGSGRIAALTPVQRLRTVCRERDVHITGDDRIREAQAADLLGIKCKTLRNWRYALDPRTPAHIIRNGIVLYDIGAVAEHMSENSCPQVPATALDSLAGLALIVDNGAEHEGSHDQQPRFHKSQRPVCR